MKPLIPVLTLFIGGLCLSMPVSADYPLTADSRPQPGVPKGTVTQHRWERSQVYPGTVRDYWIYVPAQYDAAKPACLMVFQDGGGYVNEKGHSRVPTVFDNLIHKKEMPITIGVFVNPGTIPAVRSGAKARSNRSFEYDSLGSRYSKFLIDEFLPAVTKDFNLVDDAQGRGVVGISSGGICAFTVSYTHLTLPTIYPV